MPLLYQTAHKRGADIAAGRTVIHAPGYNIIVSLRDRIMQTVHYIHSDKYIGIAGMQFNTVSMEIYDIR